jgi:8-oxo-dGTP diphosphatase
MNHIPQISQLATLCYIRKEGRTLMMHRDSSPADVHYGKWNGLGGKFMPGESPEDCVKREILEESGLEIYAPKLAGILTFPNFSHNKDWYVFVFTADIFTGTLKPSKEGSLSWIDDHDLLNLQLWEGDSYFLPLVLERRFFLGTFRYKEGTLTDHQLTIY